MTRSNLAQVDPRTGATEVPAIRRVRADHCWDLVTVRLLPGQTLDQWREAAPGLAASRGVWRVDVEQVTPRDVRLAFERRPAFSPSSIVAPAPIPATPADVNLGAIPLGHDEYGRPWTVPILGGHLCVAGAPGAGKGSIIWGVLRGLGPLIRDGLCRVHMIDCKGAMESSHGQGLWASQAGTAEEGAQLIQDLASRMAARSARLAEQKIRKLDLQHLTDEPIELLVVDELAAMTAYAPTTAVGLAVRRYLGLVVSQGRAPGYPVLAAYQEPTKEVNPARAMFARRICLRTENETYVDLALGEGARHAGARADLIPEDLPGVGYVQAESGRPRRVRAAWVADADIAELVETCAPGRGADVIPLRRPA